jgi:hypothetical protein
VASKVRRPPTLLRNNTPNEESPEATGLRPATVPEVAQKRLVTVASFSRYVMRRGKGSWQRGRFAYSWKYAATSKTMRESVGAPLNGLLV